MVLGVSTQIQLTGGVRFSGATRLLVWFFAGQFRAVLWSVERFGYASRWSDPLKQREMNPRGYQTAILKALEDERYDWRTIKGLVTDTGAPEKNVVSALNSLSDRLVRAQDADGRSLFTTREHYEKTHGFGDKLLSALADMIVA